MTYVDTFDWRLFQKGSRLAAAVEDGTLVLFWRPPGEESFCRLPVEAMPDFVWDLPAGPIKDQVESVVDVRRLLPVAELSLEGTLWDVVDRRQKTLLTVVLEGGAAVNPVDPSAGIAYLPRCESFRSRDTATSTARLVLRSSATDRTPTRPARWIWRSRSSIVTRSTRWPGPRRIFNRINAATSR